MHTHARMAPVAEAFRVTSLMRVHLFALDDIGTLMVAVVEEPSVVVVDEPSLKL